MDLDPDLLARPESSAPPGLLTIGTQRHKRINIRISSRDLADLQKRALKEGMPYQTLVSSVLHKYVTGRLVEKSST